MSENPIKALRVGQLDAAELDGEVLNLTKSQLNQVFKYLQTDILIKYGPEVNAVLKFILWKFTVFSSGSTAGQQILNIQYAHKQSWIGRRQKIAYAILLIVCPWLRDRTGEITNILQLSAWSNQINQCLKWLENGIKLASLVNFLIFLNRGGYLTLLERMLGIKSMYPQSQSIRQVSFEYMTRELLWHGFSEFLFFILPLINLQKIKNTIKRWSGGKSHTHKLLHQRTEKDYKSCAVCSDWPINPHEIGCQHIFCYFCLYSHYKADPAFTCPLCSYPITDQNSLQPVFKTLKPNR